MTFLEKCSELFNKDDLYDILGVTKGATLKEIKKGYHHMSLKVHPDRVQPQQKQWATTQFQALGRIYSVLSDKDRRAVYDETGCVEEADEPAVEQERDWEQYWRLLFKPISVADIERFEQQYVGSDEERQDLRAAYLACAGDMGAIVERVPCASADSEPRLRRLLQTMLDDGRLPAYSAFTDESDAKRAARKRRAAREAEEAAQLSAELGLGATCGDSLAAVIQARQGARQAAMGSFFDQLEAKYAKQNKSTPRRKKTGK